MTTSHANQRGNSADRRRRKQWMLAHFGNGRVARCWECGTKVTFETMVVDRIKPGKHGGKYVRGNIRPQCWVCSNKQGYRLGVGGTTVRQGNGGKSLLVDTRNTAPSDVSRLGNALARFIRRFFTAIGFIIAAVILITAIQLGALWAVVGIVAGISLGVVKEVRALNRN